MAALPLIAAITSIAGAGAGIASLAIGPGKLPAPTATVKRDDIVDQIATEDVLRRRRGGVADIMTGSSGAEAAPTATGKQTLGS